MTLKEKDRWQIEQKKLFENMYTIKDGDFVEINKLKINLHKNVFAPSLFPESKWFAKQLSETIVKKGENFLEVGVGSGLISLLCSIAGANVTGVDINQDAVNLTKLNFKNHYGTNSSKVDNILHSDLFQSIPKGTKFKYIFWNHPWQFSKSSVNKELQSEKTLDDSYSLLKRYFSGSFNYLSNDGYLLLGTCNFANINEIINIADSFNLDTILLRKGDDILGVSDVKEIYYILKIVN